MDKTEFEANVKLITEAVSKALAASQSAKPAAQPTAATETAAPAYAHTCADANEPVVIQGLGNGKDLITEKEVFQMIERNQTTLVCSRETIITALAQDRIKLAGIKVVRQ